MFQHPLRDLQQQSKVHTCITNISTEQLEYEIRTKAEENICLFTLAESPPCSTRISRTKSLQGSRGRCRAEDADWSKTPPRLPSASWWPSPCPSRSCCHRSEPAAGRRRSGICLWKSSNRITKTITEYLKSMVPKRSIMLSQLKEFN